MRTVAIMLILAAMPMLGQELEILDYPALQDLLSAKEYKKYGEKNRYKDHLDIYRKAIENQSSALRGLIRKKNLDELPQFLLNIRALSHYALEDPTRTSASSKDLRSKQVIKLEIQLRKLLGNLDDMKFSVPFEFNAEFESTSRIVEILRNQLLKQIFGRN